MKCLGPLLIVLLLASAAAGETLHVFPDGSGDYPTIQSAINASSDGDSVLLADGLYTGEGNRDLLYGSRWIMVCSESGDPDLCIIDCQGSPADPHYGMWIDITGSKASPRTMQGLTGVTVRNAWTEYAGAMHISDGAAPLISHCNFIDNHGEAMGGVVSVSESGGVWENCLFQGNSAGRGGVFAMNYYGSVQARDCTFVGSSATQGGVLYAIHSNWNVSFTGCTFYGNAADHGSVFYMESGSQVDLERCILAFGQGHDVIFCQDTSNATLVCCDIFGNQYGDWTGVIADQLGLDGNISEDPLFCDAPAGNLLLYDVSPCAPFSPPNEQCDLIGAWPVGCELTATEPTSWSRVKPLYGF
jgi:hypothetical protein